MTSTDPYLRTDTDKSETSPDSDLRLRTDADKVSAPAGGTVQLLVDGGSIQLSVDGGDIQKIVD